MSKQSVALVTSAMAARDWTTPLPQRQYARMHADRQVPRRQPADEQLELAVEMLRMLADTTRVRVLWALLDGELAVNNLADAVGKPRSGVSQHLAKLRLARLVTTRKQGNQVFYRLDNPHVRQLVEDAIHHAEHAGTDLPDHHRADTGITALTELASRARRGTP
jgi:DNA-binding transcriptional ArsR family regulator